MISNEKHNVALNNTSTSPIAMIIGNQRYHTAISSNSMVWAREQLPYVPDGSVFLVDQFLQAHGRQSRTWDVQPGQLLITFVLKPNINITQNLLPSLNMAISLGILDPLRHAGVSLKWPNDFVLNQKKLGGMILELVWQHQQLQGVIIGFALNINNIFDSTHHLFSQALSLRMATDNMYDLTTLQEELFTSLDHWYHRWLAGNHDAIFSTWRQHQSYKGQIIKTHLKTGEIITGLVQDVLQDGSLILEINGQKQVLHHYLVDQITTQQPESPVDK